MILYVAVLFFVLTPGILVSLPAGGSKTTVALVHALVFALVFWATHKLVWTCCKKVHFGRLESFHKSESAGNSLAIESHFGQNSLSGASPYSYKKK